MHNIYIDGSSQVQNNLIGIGVYNSTTKFELAMVKNGKDVFEAESEALEEAIRYAQMNNIVKESRIFTDSQQVYNELKDYVLSLGFSDLIWIPRELNTVADKLSTAYKSYSKNVSTKISLKDCTVTKTTKIKETTNLKSLDKKEIVNLLNEFSLEKRTKLIDKLKDATNVNKAVWNYYFGDAKVISKNKKNTYYKLIPLLIPGTKNNKSKANLLNEITTTGITMLLDNLKLKESKC